MHDQEAPMLKQLVSEGSLPQVSHRLPRQPLLVETLEQGRKYGGVLRIGEITPRFCHYLRHMNEAPLLEVGDWREYHHYSRMDGPVLPGVLEAFGSEPDGLRHWFRIRGGLRWSDGEPVTTRDVEYAVKDVLLHPELKRFLTNSEHSEIMMPEWEWLMWGDSPVRLEIRDEEEFVLEFAKPYPGFIRQQVRSARWQMFLRPFHYLKKFHQKYADPDSLKQVMQERGFALETWAEFYQAQDPAIREAGYHLPARIPNIWEYPVLDPWVFTEASTMKTGILTRNPYYYAVDQQGKQLPYVDTVIRTLYADVEALRQAAEAGELDVSGCFLKITDQRLYQRKGAECGYRIALLPLWQVQQVILLINLCPADQALWGIVQDIRFRQAVSLALNRERMRTEVFSGYGEVSQLTAGRMRSYYQKEWADVCAKYNPQQAKYMLNELGMVSDENSGFRNIQGREVIFKLVYYPVTPMADEAAAQIEADLGKVGIRLQVTRLHSGSEMGAYQEANEHVFGIWEMAGDDPLIPYQIGGLSDPVPRWWRWYETSGREGSEPTAPAKALYQLRDRLKLAVSEEERHQLAAEIYRLQAENLWCIGTVAEVPQVFLYQNKLRNVLGEEEIFLPGVLSGARQWCWDNP